MNSTNTVLQNETKETKNFELLRLKDGTEVSIPKKMMKKGYSTLSKIQLDRWYNSYYFMAEYLQKFDNGEDVAITTGDYLFPADEHNLYLGYIVQARTFEVKCKKYLYLDIVIDNNIIKTVRSDIALFSDKISKAIRNKFGQVYNVSDLLDNLVRFQIHNSFNENGEVIFSKVVGFVFCEKSIEDELFAIYDAII